MTHMRKFISMMESIVEPLTEETFDPTDGAIVFDGSWPLFLGKLHELSPGISEEDACAHLNINPMTFENAVHAAIVGWRESPKASLLHAISYLDAGEVPQEGKAIFKDKVWQRRFVESLIRSRLAFRHNFEFINGNDFEMEYRIRPQGKDTQLASLNRIIRCLYLYWYLSRSKKVKLPKLIYRGIRAHELCNHDSLKDAINALYVKDRTHEMDGKVAMDVLFKWICDKKLHQITDGAILSFTTSMPVAKYFAHGEGFILAVDPSKVEIVTSNLHDERLEGHDPVSGKDEKEWIVRIPHDYQFTMDDIIIHDLDYFIAEENPLSVTIFDHDDKAAEYDMNGKHIEARFYWNNSGDKGSVRFNNETRKDFKADHGFDPMPDPKNLGQISNFKIKKVNNSRW